jgi:hypothetical protein
MNKYCLPLELVVYCLDSCNENCELFNKNVLSIEFVELVQRLEIGL